MWVCFIDLGRLSLALSLQEKPLLAAPSSSDVIQRGESVSTGVATPLLTVCEHTHTPVSHIVRDNRVYQIRVLLLLFANAYSGRCSDSSRNLSFTAVRLGNVTAVKG